MTWREWLTLWGATIAFTAVVVGLVFALGGWALLIIFPVIIVGGGFVVTNQ